MFTPEQFRAKAAECAESLKNSVVPSEIREFQRARQSFSLLAQNKGRDQRAYSSMPRGGPHYEVEHPPCEGRLSVSSTIIRTTKTDQFSTHIGPRIRARESVPVRHQHLR
jgi:hypothetical protein